MPVHRVPRSTLPESIDKLEAAGLEVVWPPLTSDEDNVLVYTRPDRRMSVGAESWGRYAPTETRGGAA